MSDALSPLFLCRGKAVCICFMLGRSGSVIGSNIVASILEDYCNITFGVFYILALGKYYPCFHCFINKYLVIFILLCFSYIFSFIKKSIKHIYLVIRLLFGYNFIAVCAVLAYVLPI